jgi:dolichol-phosphate mannosyltransferase
MALISIIIPVYFNAATLEALQMRLAALAERHPKLDFEFIYVDDGSGDHSLAVLRHLAEQDRRLVVVKMSRNFGSQTAILAGISQARGQAVGFVAADLQDPPETLDEMIAAWQQGERVVLAVRRDRKGDPWATRLFSNLFNALFSKLVFSGFSPQGVGFFLIDRQVAQVLLQCEEKNPHLVGLIYWTGFPLHSVLYERVERTSGKSRWTFRKKIKYFIDAFVAFSYLPLRAASVMGIVLALAGGLYAAALVALRLAGTVQVEGWTALMVVVLLLSGVQLLMLGVIGEYLWRNFDASRRRPVFIIDQVIQSRHTEPAEHANLVSEQRGNSQ